MPENNSTAQSNGFQEEKRNLGFVKLRRGLKEHLHRSRMSSNASTLFVWLLLSAYHSGPKRGCVDVNIEDLMLGLGWSRSMTKRTLEELTLSGYVSFSGAANQHGLGTIRILKFDVEESESARLTSEPSVDRGSSGELSARLSAGFTSEPSSEPSTPSKLQTHQDLQAPKNAVEVKKEEKEAEEAAAAPAGSAGSSTNKENRKRSKRAWENICIEPCGSVRFCETWERIYEEASGFEAGDLLSVVMERAIQYCQANGIKVPPPFFDAKRLVEDDERNRESDEVARVAGPRGVREELMR